MLICYLFDYMSTAVSFRFIKIQTPVVAVLAEVHLLTEQVQWVFLQVTLECSGIDLQGFVGEAPQESLGIHMGRT